MPLTFPFLTVAVSTVSEFLYVIITSPSMYPSLNSHFKTSPCCVVSVPFPSAFPSFSVPTNVVPSLSLTIPCPCI